MDCIEGMKQLGDNSIDSIVTDPPYELGFMGKKWDNSGIAYNVELWKEAFRLLKPGGHLLSFGGTRTYHRMACAIEDAGFEIRDQIQWIYGSGFPKSLNIGKAIDKNGGNQLNWFIPYIIEVAKEKGITKKQLTDLFPSKNGNPTGWLYNKIKCQNITIEQYNKIKDFLELPFTSLEEAEREVIGKSKTNKTVYQRIGSDNEGGEIDITAPATDQAKQWDGWGTALKPAHEPIVVARKPLAEKTVAENVLKYGTGGINIDECRIRTTDKDLNNIIKKNNSFGNVNNKEYDGIHFVNTNRNIKVNLQGRFPSNVIHDGSQEVISLLGEPQRFFYCAKASKSERNKGLEGFEDKQKIFNGQSDKSSEDMKDVEKRFTTEPTKNNHPTVKPLKLMEYLVRLVTPKDGVVLDPFMGSGTTGIAAKSQGYNYIGFDMTEEYCKIAEARIKSVERQKRLF